MSRATRDRFGWNRVVYGDGTVAPTVKDLLQARRSLSRSLDSDFIDGHLKGVQPLERTILAAAQELPPGHALRDDWTVVSNEEVPGEEVPGEGDLALLLRNAIDRARFGRRAAIALSGGLDSAIVLALASDLPAYVLSPRLPGYDERESALETARGVGACVTVVEVEAEDFVAALPDAIGYIETPLYNLHPVAKLLLARAVARDGIELVLSGDGADHVLGRDRSADYLPLVKALFDGAGVELRSPFLDEAVVAACLARPPDPEKACLRRIGAELPIPAALVRGKKRGGWAPALDLSRFAPKIAPLAHRLGREPRLTTDRERVVWTTLALLVDAVESW